MDAFMHFADVPVVDLGDHPGVAPLFSPCSSEAHAEIPWPDWSFWSGKVGSPQNGESQALAALPFGCDHDV